MKTLPTLADARRGHVEKQSYLDGGRASRFDSSVPRVALHFYALTYRDQGAVISDNPPVWLFEPVDTEVEDFPELDGVTFLRLIDDPDQEVVQIGVEYGYACYMDNGRTPYRCSAVLKTVAAATEYMTGMHDFPFFPPHPQPERLYVARCDEPEVKLITLEGPVNA